MRKKLYIADAFSSFPRENRIDTRFLKAEVPIVHTRLTSSDNKAKEFQKVTKSDAELVQLKVFLKCDWPSDIKEIQKT